MAGKAFDNLNKIFLSDTFRAWFDKTNQIVSTINPIEVYGITAMSGNYAGITCVIGTDGIANVGLSLPSSLSGDFSFNTGVTFANFVNISGLTLDLAPNGGHGATAYGRVVRSVNGATGDILLTHVNTPGNVADGDVLYYEATGSTFHGYNLFSGGTAEGHMFHIGASGGIFIGATGGSAASFIKTGNIQLIADGATSSGIYFTDNAQAPLSTTKIAGADVRYGTDKGSHLFTVGGRGPSGVKHSSQNLILDFDKQTLSVGGAETGDASVHIGDVSNIGTPILYTDGSGSTFAISYLSERENGGRSSGGFTSGSEYGSVFLGQPEVRGLKNDQRLRLEYTAGSVEVEITGTGKTSGFAVYGRDISSPYGGMLTPTMVARRDGNLVIGGIAPNDGINGGGTGTTHGGLNIASGKLNIQGSAGAVISSGYQFLHSDGVSADWRAFNSTSSNFSGDVAAIANASVTENPANGLKITILQTNGVRTLIRGLKKDGSEMTGTFSASIHFPRVRVTGQAGGSNGAVLGVRMIKDGAITDKIIDWDDINKGEAWTVTNIDPTFTFSGKCKNSVHFIPFMTKGTIQEIEKGFIFCEKGSYLLTFNELG